MVLDLAKHMATKIDDESHQHVWIMVANFGIPPEKLAQFLASRDAYANDAGPKDEDGNQIFQKVNFELVQETCLGFDGPGCLKCGNHILNEEHGYGTRCQISNEEYEAAGSPAITPQSVVKTEPEPDAFVVIEKQLLVPKHEAGQ